jgi:protein gp37
MLLLSEEGQTSIDWPLRVKKSQGIFPASMTDWLGEFVPEYWSNWMLATMALGQHHIFLPLTKRPQRLYQMLKYWTLSGNAISVPPTDTYKRAIMQAVKNSPKWMGGQNGLPIVTANDTAQVITPWPPPNIFFGVSLTNEEEADKYRPIFQQIRELGQFKLWVSYEPALDTVDWLEYSWDKLIDWLVVGGESGPNARPMPLDAVLYAASFGMETAIPVYVKQLGSVLAEEYGASDSKGVEIPDGLPWEFGFRQFPDISKSYIPWK